LEKKGARRAGRNFATASGPLMQLWRAPVAEPEQRERLPLPLVETFDLAGRTLACSEPNVTDITVCTRRDLRCAGDRPDARAGALTSNAMKPIVH